jgi:predicted CoA-binding protein
VVVPSIAASEVVRDAAAAGVRHVWLQQGAESPALVALCRHLGLTVVSNECVLMHAQPKGFHKLHRWIWGALGKLPA